ncbi:hypothetical protein [Helicobacter sp. 11S03491-1]|nr:hypothetical protein [Helicobacter sp. 11S03491-1]
MIKKISIINLLLSLVMSDEIPDIQSKILNATENLPQDPGLENIRELPE